MYTTIEAELKDGRIIPLEPREIPMNGKVLVTTLQEEEDVEISSEEWMQRWDDLTRKINDAWKNDRNAVEILSEMRR